MDGPSRQINDQVQIEAVTDAVGNIVEVKKAKKKLSKREEKAMVKTLKAKIDAGEDLDSDEEEFATANGLFAL